MYDAIIVGARCAGAPLAMLLARRGAHVLLVDRAAFPSDIPHGHFIHWRGPRTLQRWGLLDAVSAVSPPISTMVTDMGDFPLFVGDLWEQGAAWGYGPRRSTLDKILVDAAVAAGAEFRDGFNVDEYVFEGDSIVGMKGHEADGAAIEERATITIGADGRNSHLARTVQAPQYNVTPTLTGYYFSYWTGVENAGFELYARHEQRRMIVSFQTDGGLFAIFVSFAVEDLAEFKTDIEKSFMSALDLAPDFAARVRQGKRVERFYGATDLPNFYRKPYGPGWALVGDAGYHKDPYLALGISDAFEDAELLSEAISQSLGGTTAIEEALAGYETRRNEASAATYQENLASARMEPLPPQLLGMRAAVRDKPADATRMVKASRGMVDRSEFFNPETMQRLLGPSTTRA